jgi:hypothetical protein
MMSTTTTNSNPFANACGVLGAAFGFLMVAGETGDFGAAIGAALVCGVIGVVVGHVVTAAVRVIISLLLFFLVVLPILAILGRLGDASSPAAMLPEPAPHVDVTACHRAGGRLAI